MDLYICYPSSHEPCGILEVKCPYSKRDITPEEACKDPDFYCTFENGRLNLKRSHQYFHQVQLQLYVCSDFCSWCDFCVYTTKGCLVCRQQLDSDWVSQCIPELEFYFNPEIVCPKVKPANHSTYYFYLSPQHAAKQVITGMCT